MSHFAGEKNIFRFSGTQQGNGDIIDIGSRGAGENQSVNGLQCMIGIVAVQRVLGRKAQGFQGKGSIPIGIAPCGIGGAVGSVGACADDAGISHPLNYRSCTQGNFLIPAPQAGSGEMHHRFAPCQECKLPAGGGMTAEDAPQKTAGFPGLTAQMIRQKYRFVAQFPAHPLRGSAELPDTADDLHMYIVQNLGCFPLQKGKGFPAQRKGILFHSFHCLLAGGEIRRDGAGSDNIRGITQPVDEFPVEPLGYDLILAASVLEHLDSRESMERKLLGIAAGIRPGGAVLIVMNTGVREWDTKTGEPLDPQFEVNLPPQDVRSLLEDNFSGWQILWDKCIHYEYEVPRGSQMAMICAEVVTFAARRPEGSK